MAPALPLWLQDLAIASLAAAAATALWLVVDLVKHPQKMWIMDVVWPITAFYLGPLTLWLYYRFGRLSAKSAAQSGDDKPFPAITALAVSHCGAGCTLGDLIAENALYFTGAMFTASWLGTFLVGDYVLAYLLGIAFQYFTIAPMRGISGPAGIWAAMKADTLSLTAFEIGLFAWMWGMDTLFHGRLHPDRVVYWFSMQIGMALGYLTAYPMNWWLVKRGLKEAM